MASVMVISHYQNVTKDYSKEDYDKANLVLVKKENRYTVIKDETHTYAKFACMTRERFWSFMKDKVLL